MGEKKNGRKWQRTHAHASTCKHRRTCTCTLHEHTQAQIYLNFRRAQAAIPTAHGGQTRRRSESPRSKYTAASVVSAFMCWRSHACACVERMEEAVVCAFVHAVSTRARVCECVRAGGRACSMPTCAMALCRVSFARLVAAFLRSAC